MKLEDVKRGMKVKLLGKHGAGDNFDDINDWFEDCNDFKDVQRIEEQGYGVVVDICADDSIRVADTIDGDSWWFLISDLEPYKEEAEMNLSKDNKKSTIEIKDLVYDIENGTTIVYFADGTKKIARTEEGTDFDKEIGLLECLGKKLFGNRDGLLKIIESGKIIERKKKGKVVDEGVVFGRFLKGEKLLSTVKPKTKL